MNEHDPLISIIVPAYNCEDYIEETFNSVLLQDYTNWEIIFIDDGSTDNTYSKILNIRSREDRVVVLQQANGRQGKARNFGLKEAKGDLIAFLDADDLWPPNKLSWQLNEMQKSKADLTFTDGYICLNNNMNLREYRFGVIDEFYNGEKGVQTFHLQNRTPTSSVLVKKSALIKVGGFSEKKEIQNCEDYLLWTNLLCNGFTLQGLSNPLLYYRVHGTSSTGQEINGLIPLLVALLSIPGEHKENRRRHLEKTFMRLIVLLDEQKSLSKLEPYVCDVIDAIRHKRTAFLLKKMWFVNKRIFKSIVWRTAIK